MNDDRFAKDLLEECWNCEFLITCRSSNVKPYRRLRENTCPIFRVLRRNA